MSWDWVKIKDIKSIGKYSLVGGPFGSDLSGKHYEETGVPVIRGGNLPFGKKFDNSNFVYVSEKKANSLIANTAYPGDIVFTQRGTLGQVGIVPNDFDRYIISQSQMKLTVNEAIASPLYIYYYFRTEEAIKRIENIALSSGVPHTNLGILQNFKIPFPPLPIQNKIASILSAYDDLIENNNQRIKLLEEMAEEIYKEWFVRMRFPGYKDSKFFDADGNEVPYGTVGALPKGWENIGIYHVFDINYGKNLAQTDILNEGPYPVYGASGIMGYFSDYNSLNKTVLITSRGNGSGDIHRTREIAFITNNSFLIQPKENYKNINLSYIFEFFKRLNLKRFCTGSAQPQLTNHSLENLKIEIPEEGKINLYCSIVDPMIDEIDLLFNKNKLLQETRDLLLPRLISGKLSVEDLDIENTITQAMAAEPEVIY